jgi:hypothetical protein
VGQQVTARAWHRHLLHAVMTHLANLLLTWSRRAALQLWGTSDRDFRAVQLTPAAAGEDQQAAPLDQPTLAAAWHSSNQTLLSVAKVGVHVGPRASQENSRWLWLGPLCPPPAGMHAQSCHQDCKKPAV